MLDPLIFQRIARFQEGDIQAFQLVKQRRYILRRGQFARTARRLAQQHTAALLVQCAEMAVYGIFHVAAFLH
ncbi:hypothetical protein D3C74_482090 [compost metagenome]